MRRLPAVLGAVVLVLAGGVAATVAALPAHADTQICSQYGSTKIQGGKYIVQNNVWGDSTTQCINVTDNGFAVTSAAHNLPQNGAPGAYPSVCKSLPGGFARICASRPARPSKPAEHPRRRLIPSGVEEQDGWRLRLHRDLACRRAGAVEAVRGSGIADRQHRERLRIHAAI